MRHQTFASRAFHEPPWNPQGFGLRQSSGAFAFTGVRKAAEDCRSPKRFAMWAAARSRDFVPGTLRAYTRRHNLLRIRCTLVVNSRKRRKRRIPARCRDCLSFLLFEAMRHQLRRDPKVCHGQPTFRGTRILVADVLEQVASGMAWESIIEEWRGGVSAGAIAEAVRTAGETFLPAPPAPQRLRCPVQPNGGSPPPHPHRPGRLAAPGGA